MSEACEFGFRVQFYADPEISPDIEAWHDGFETADTSVLTWVYNTLHDTDLRELLSPPEGVDWQVVGRGRLRSWYDDFTQEWDESLSVLSSQGQAVVVPAPLEIDPQERQARLISYQEVMLIAIKVTADELDPTMSPQAIVTLRERLLQVLAGFSGV